MKIAKVFFAYIGVYFCMVCFSTGYAETNTVSFAEKLLQEGLNEENSQILLTQTVPEIIEITHSYLCIEKDLIRTDTYLRTIEGVISDQGVWLGLYSRLLKDITYPSTRLSVLESIARTIPEKGRPILENELSIMDAPLKCRIIEIIASYNDTRAVALIIPLLKNSDCSITAIRALAQIADASSVPVLIPLVKSSNRKVRRIASMALHTITGYDFGGSYNLWSLWWKQYGASFLHKRLLRDFRKVHAVRDYSPIQKELWKYFVSEINRIDIANMTSSYEIDTVLNDIMKNPNGWRGVVCSLTGIVQTVEDLPEAGVQICNLVVQTYPFCQIIVPHGTVKKNERMRFNAVFYKIHGQTHDSKPAILFVGKPITVSVPRSKNIIGKLIELLGSPDDQKRQNAYSRLLKMKDQAVPALTVAAQSNTQSLIRSSALLILARLDITKALPLIEEAFMSTDPLVRASAGMALESAFDENELQKNIKKLKPLR